MTNRRILFSVISTVFLVTLGFQNCGKPVVPVNKSGPGQVDLNDDDTGANIDGSSKALPVGNWQRPCTYDQGYNAYYLTSVIISDSIFDTQTTWHYDSACSDPTLHYLTEHQTRRILDVFEYGPGIVVESELQIQTLEYHEQSTVDYHNGDATCGISDWQMNVERDTNNEICGRPRIISDLIVVNQFFLQRSLDEVLSLDESVGRLPVQENTFYRQ